MKAPRVFLLACLLFVGGWKANAQTGVTQPGDPIFASSSNSPGSEGVANAIDNAATKYLNFDTRLPGNTPSGFAVSPSMGVTRVVGMTIESANDAPERDPKTVTLEGSNDPSITSYSSGNWEMIATITAPDFTNRFQTQTFFFDNFKAYRHYRWTVTSVAIPNACCMQVAEVGLLGSTNVFTPGMPLGTNEMNSLQASASNSLVKFQSHITPANFNLMGFNSTNEVQTATNGGPLLFFSVPITQLTNYQMGNDFSLLLNPPPPPRAIIPVLAGTNVRSSITLDFTHTQPGVAPSWAGDIWGHPKMIRNVTGTYDSITNANILPGTAPFVVEIPVPRIWLVGYYDAQTNLTLLSTINLDLGSISIGRNNAITQPAMAKMSSEAQRYNPDLPN